VILSIQKADLWKRVSAALFDVIMLCILIVGFAFIFSKIVGYDKHITALEDVYAKYEEKYGISSDITLEQIEAMTAEEQQKYKDADAEMFTDPEYQNSIMMVFQLTLTIVSLSILFSYLIWDFAIPLRLKNGQTLGKKIFGVGVMRVDGIKVTAPLMFIRTILGKFTIETMVPVLILLMLLFGTIGIFGLLTLGLILLLQIILLIVTKTNSAIHDVLAKTVAVDIASQMIFEDEESLVEYKKKLYAEKAARESYF